MKGEWVYNESFYTKEQCDFIIEKALKITPEDPTLGYEGKVGDDNYRRSKVRWIHPENQDFWMVFEDYWKMLLNVNKNWYGFNINSLPYLQFTEYDESYKGEYKSHQDVFWINPSNNHRKVTFVLQLSDEQTYEGGDLVLENLTETPPAEIVRKQGTLLTFPSFVYHRLTPVTKGKRYSLVGWFEGPKFT
jgi:PKHD-type hydroxylase